MPDDAALRFVREAPLTYGPWRELKGQYKRLEADPNADPELLGTLIAKLDSAPLTAPTAPPRVKLGQVQSITALAAQGEQMAMAFQRSYNSHWLAVFDFSGPDKLNPKKLGEVKTEPGKPVEQLLWCGPLVVVRQGEKVHVYEPERQELKRLASLTVDAHFVAARFPYLVVVVHNALKIIDLRNVTGAAVVIEVRGASQVSLNEGLAAVLCESVGFAWNRLPSPGGLKLFDIQDLTRPRAVGELDCPDGKAIALEGRQLLVLTHPGNYSHAHLWSWDISNPRQPVRTGSLALGQRYQLPPAVVEGEHVYLLEGMRLDLFKTADLTRVGSVPANTSLGACTSTPDWLFASTYGSGLSVWSLAHPTRPTSFGTPPSARTLGYMKRRARRHLKALAKTTPERFVDVAFRVLEGSVEVIDGKTNWVTYDLLFGAGARFYQQSHGRGAVTEKAARGLSLRRREERCAEAWNARPDLAKLLYAKKNVSWMARELGLKALRAARAVPPRLSPAALSASLESPSLLLIADAVRQIETGSPELLALAFAKAVARQRTRLVPCILAQAAEPKWRVTFTETLMGATKTSGRRFAATAALLATHFSESIGGEQVIRLVPGLLASGKIELRELALAAAKSVDEGTAEEWLLLLSQLSEADRELLLQALEAGVAGKDLGEPWELIEADDALVREAGWRLLAASATSGETLRAFWDELLEATSLNPNLLTAMRSTYALATLGRAGFTSDELAALLTTRPFLVGLLTVAAFSSLTQTLPIETTLRLIAAADDDAWGRLRDGWLRNLREGLGVRALWLALPAALTGDTTGRIEARVLADTAIAETLLTEDDAHALLELREAALGPLLGRWFVRHWPIIEQSNALLLTAATHPLPDIRTAALELVRRRTVSLAFALRLLECEIPACVAVGRQWFATPSVAHLLALCDSPVASVRAWGREQVLARRAQLDTDALCKALFEHDAPDMQAFAAVLAGELPAPDFDRTVLRTRHKARRAKEQVKQRQERATPSAQVDLATLLALARGTGTPRDAEWALSQLAKRALAGEKIDGLEIG